MEEQKDTNSATDQTGKERDKKISFSILRVLAGLRDFARSTMNLQAESDQEGTIETIKKDMVFRGHVVWVLVCSILIASIGLNLNSTAVVIGAMLISPLMGPILAIGLAVGTNDWETLRRALKNFGVMVVVAIITSTVYFFITPLHEAQTELLARTKPTFLDALIAIFGGLAGIIGVSRRNRGNVIPGVAIATALMPPLCTAGYGLATGQWAFFFGAFYLFTLNSIFIAGATFLIVRYLNYPLVSFVDVATEKRAKRYMVALSIIVLLPSAWIFYGLVKETIFKGKAEAFISENIDLEGTEIISKKISYSDTLSRIDIFIMGEPITVQTREQIENRMAAEGLERTILKIHQPKDVSGDIAGRLSKEVRVGVLEDLYQRNELQMRKKDSLIGQLTEQLVSYKRNRIPFENVRKEIGINHPQVNRFAYASMVEMNGGAIDTIPTFMLQWDKVNSREKQQQTETIQRWLKQRLSLDTVRVIEF